MSGIFPVARFGTIAWVWTIGFCAGAIYFGWRTWAAISAGRAPDNYDLGAMLLLIMFIIIGWIRSVRRYRLGDNNLYIEKRASRKITLPLESIRLIEAMATPVSFFNTSLFSMGGLFGWSGRTQLRKSSDTHALNAEVYGTNPANVVIIGLNDDRTYALTPADPEGLVQAVRATMQPAKPPESNISRGSRTARKGKKG